MTARRRRKRKRRRARKDARRARLDRWTLSLLIACASCWLVLALHGRLELGLEPIHRALLYHASLYSSVLACALGWRSGELDVRWASRAFVAGSLFVWAHTWAGPLQDLTAWLFRVRYLWLEV